MVKTYSNRTKKALYVVAYDIVDNKRRNRMVKLLEPYGRRINYSVFECLVQKSQVDRFLNEIGSLIDPKVDQVVCYNICVDCYAKTYYIPAVPSPGKVTVVV